MAGEVAHVLHVDLFAAISFPAVKLQILYNEAKRQRMLDSVDQARAWGLKSDDVDKAMKIHGNYTDGFHEEQLEALFARMGK